VCVCLSLIALVHPSNNFLSQLRIDGESSVHFPFMHTHTATKTTVTSITTSKDYKWILWILWILLCNSHAKKQTVQTVKSVQTFHQSSEPQTQFCAHHHFVFIINFVFRSPYVSVEFILPSTSPLPSLSFRECGPHI